MFILILGTEIVLPKWVVNLQVGKIVTWLNLTWTYASSTCKLQVDLDLDRTLVRIHGESSKTNPSVHIENKTDPDIINLTFHADVVISTSKSEGMSGSLLHAMCLAKPIISADIPANRELLAEGDGFLENHSQCIVLRLPPPHRLSTTFFRFKTCR